MLQAGHTPEAISSAVVDLSRARAVARFREGLMAVQKLPAAPEIIHQVLEMTAQEDATVSALAALVERDQSLAARILGLANSSMMGARTRVTTIAQAVMLLGFSHVRDIALGLSLWGGFTAKEGIDRERQKALWRHSLMVAGAARRLAQDAGHEAATSFTAGLLHDIGKLVLGLRLGESYWGLVDDAAERGLGLAVLERDAFDCDHATVGAWLLELWGVPPVLTAPVARHHGPLDLRGPATVGLTVAIADRLINAAASEDDEALGHALAHVERFAPKWLTAERWVTLYAELSAEEGELDTILRAA